MRTIDQSNYEEWIFEYYEGTLTAEEEARVLDFVQMNSSYMEEFEAFAKTYLREPLPDKLSIESVLLKKESHFSLNYLIASTLVLLVSGLFLIKKSEEHSKVIKFSKESVNKDIHQEKELAIKNSPSVQKHSFTIRQLGRTESFEQRGTHVKIQVPDTGYIPITDKVHETVRITESTLASDFDSLPEKQQVTIKLEKESVGNTKTTVQKTRQEKKEAKRKLKQIAKFKEKQRRNRDAQQLMKGNMPYVVPLDPNTF